MSYFFMCHSQVQTRDAREAPFQLCGVVSNADEKYCEQYQSKNAVGTDFDYPYL